MRNPATCDHQTARSQPVLRYDSESDQMVTRYEMVTVSAEQDIDNHRYKCSLCGQIGYYSGAARTYYETGTDPTGGLVSGS